MTTIRHRGEAYEANEGETVLACLDRHGVAIPRSCGGGACQTCVCIATGGSVPATARRGLSPGMLARGAFLPCVCPATDGLSMEPVDAVESRRAIVDAIEPLSSHVFRVLLRMVDPLPHHAGQFINLVRPADGVIRSYSIASLPSAHRIELHVAERTGGKMSPWLRNATGESIEVRGPAGECIYDEGRPDEPLLLAGTGTGLAPLLGIVRAAIAARHRAPIRLYHGSADEQGLYLDAELRRLAAEHPGFEYHPTVLAKHDASFSAEVGRIEAVIARELPKLGGHRVYLCGNPDAVRLLRKQTFLAGASMTSIHSDPFAFAA